MSSETKDTGKRAPYEKPVLKCHGDVQALTQVFSDTMNMVDNLSGFNLKT